MSGRRTGIGHRDRGRGAGVRGSGADWGFGIRAAAPGFRCPDWIPMPGSDPGARIGSRCPDRIPVPGSRSPVRIAPMLRQVVLSAVLACGVASVAWTQTPAPAAIDPANFTGRVTGLPSSDIRVLRYTFDPAARTN